jgi:hypothetical protein
LGHGARKTDRERQEKEKQKNRKAEIRQKDRKTHRGKNERMFARMNEKGRVKNFNYPLTQ